MLSVLRFLSPFLLAAVVAGAAEAQSVRVLGRSEPVKPAGFEVHWPDSGFEAKFTGASLTAVIEDGGSNWFEVEVDGKPKPIQLEPGRQTYSLFAGVEGPHTIKVTRRTGTPLGPTSFISIKAEGLQPLPAPERRILVIGDSIAAGYGIAGEDQWCNYTPATQNAAIAYPALLAEAFGADLQVIAADGRGLVRNYAGEEATMDVAQWRTLPGSDKAAATSWKPQLVVVNLGVNDFSHGDPGEEFDATYVKMLKKLRQTWPEAQVIAAFGAMLSGADRAAAIASVSGAVQKVRAEGDGKVHFLEFKPEGGHQFGCNWHPGRDAHRQMAQAVQAMASKSLGWR